MRLAFNFLHISFDCGILDRANYFLVVISLFFRWIVLSDTQLGSPYTSPLPTTFSLTSLTVVPEDLYLSVISTDPLQCLETN